MLYLVIADLPVLDEIDPHSEVGCIEGDIIDKAKSMHQMRSAIMPLIRGDMASLFCGLHLLEQIGMIPCFNTQDVVQTVRVQGLDMWGIRTQTVFGDDKLEVGMILAQLGDKTLGGIPLTIIFGR